MEGASDCEVAVYGEIAERGNGQGCDCCVEWIV